MTIPGVKCTVSNCRYNDQKKHCTASSIEVDVDNHLQAADDKESTMCHTFSSK